MMEICPKKASASIPVRSVKVLLGVQVSSSRKVMMLTLKIEKVSVTLLSSAPVSSVVVAVEPAKSKVRPFAAASAVQLLIR